MKIYYRIISVDKKEHSAVVRYFTDKITEDSLASSFNDDGSIVRTESGYSARCRTDVNITIFDSDFSPEQIDSHFQSSAPAAWFELQEKTIEKDTTTLLTHLVPGKVNSFTFTKPVIETSNTTGTLTDEEIDKLLNSLTTK